MCPAKPDIDMKCWLAIAGQLSMCPAKPDINMKCWLAIARQEKIDNLEKPNGYNSCDAQL